MLFVTFLYKKDFVSEEQLVDQCGLELYSEYDGYIDLDRIEQVEAYSADTVRACAVTLYSSVRLIILMNFEILAAKITLHKQTTIRDNLVTFKQ